MNQEQRLDEEPHRESQQADRTAQSAFASTRSERRRWQVINLLQAGVPLPEIVAATGYQPRTIQRIEKRYKQSGAAGLVDKRHHSAGAAPLLSPQQQSELHEALQQPPPDGGTWTGTSVAKWIAIRIGRPVHRQRGWEYVQRLRADQSAQSFSPESSANDA